MQTLYKLNLLKFTYMVKMAIIFLLIFLYENCHILIQISLEFIPKGTITDTAKTFGLLPDRRQIWARF